MYHYFWATLYITKIGRTLKSRTIQDFYRQKKTLNSVEGRSCFYMLNRTEIGQPVEELEMAKYDILAYR